MPYHHFTREERYIVSHMALAEFSFGEIGRRIGKHHGDEFRNVLAARYSAHSSLFIYHCTLPMHRFISLPVFLVMR